MGAVPYFDPTCHIRRVLTPALGMPIATKQREKVDAQGTVSFFFHDGSKVLGVSNKHVLLANPTVDYTNKGPRAPKHYVRVCGIRRFQQILTETRDLVASNVNKAVSLTKYIVELEAKPRSDDPGWVTELEYSKTQLKKVSEDNPTLQAFFKEVNGQWLDIVRRTIGWVDWAPKIAIDIDKHHYTRDIATFELEPAKFKDKFQGNVVQLRGNKLEGHELDAMFWPNNTRANPSGIKFPTDDMLRIRGVVTRELMATPDCYAESGEPTFIAGKDGNTTGFTMGRYSGAEAYLCDESGKESIEVTIYNYNQTSGNFSAKGDSGSLVFTGDGRMLAILHSGMFKGLSSHVTFATPAWWAIEQIKLQYPNADFDRESFY